eukprot:5627299-Prymnesium_polylepis.1
MGPLCAGLLPVAAPTRLLAGCPWLPPPRAGYPWVAGAAREPLGRRGPDAQLPAAQRQPDGHLRPGEQTTRATPSPCTAHLPSPCTAPLSS